MKRTIGIAFGMAIVLFLYGYISTNVGHDHSKHGEIIDEFHDDHTHNHSHH